MAEALLVVFAIVLFFLMRRQEKVSKTRQLRQEKVGYAQYFKRKQEEPIAITITLSKSLGWVTGNIISGKLANIL